MILPTKIMKVPVTISDVHFIEHILYIYMNYDTYVLNKKKMEVNVMYLKPS